MADKLYFQAQDVPSFEIFPNISGKFVHGTAITTAHWALKKGAVVPEHAHAHEQFIICQSGEFRMTVGDETHTLRAGDVLVVPSGASHYGTAVSEVKCIDVFTPVREDFKALLGAATWSSKVGNE